MCLATGQEEEEKINPIHDSTREEENNKKDHNGFKVDSVLYSIRIEIVALKGRQSVL